MLDVAESDMEVLQLDMEVYESPVTEHNPRQPTNAKEVSTNIIQSLESPVISSSSAPLWRDKSTKPKENS